jgi:phage antirepressor YoqD-like protein
MQQCHPIQGLGITQLRNLLTNMYQCKLVYSYQGEYYNQPMQRWVEAGMFEIKKRTITKPNGDLITVSTPLVTGKGQVYLVNKFLKEYVSK